MKSESITPGPIDLRGALAAFAAPLPEIGGYALCRRLRIARGALGGSMAPDAPDAVEETLLCRVDVLCLRPSNDPALAGCGLAEPRPMPVPLPSVMAATVLFSPIFGPPIADNEFVKSLEDSPDILLCRSSKLGDGRKSNGSVVVWSVGPIEPNENSE